MCGIFGFTGRTEQERYKLLEKMSKTVFHRGPDHFGYWLGGNVALGMNRLSIIDLQRGYQPMWNEDRTVVVVMNGEIYNYRILRALLHEKGHCFSTDSDTEVLVHLYEDEGPRFVEHLAGMFAYALWDSTNGKLLVGRDRMGIKPLYYCCSRDGNIAFASEAKALRELPDISKNIDLTAIGLFLGLFYIPEPLSVWSDIRKLEPGHYLEWENSCIRNIHYWDIKQVFLGAETFKLAPRTPKTKSEHYEELRGLFSEIIREHLIADVPVATLLSSGTDSTLVTTLASEAAPGITAFTIASAGEDDESATARETAKNLSIAHQVKTAEVNLLDELPLLIWHMDEPFADSSIFPTHAISRVVSQTHRVALSGDGGDEFFGGYNYYRMLPIISRISQAPRPMLSLLEFVARHTPRSMATVLAHKMGIAGSASTMRSVEFICNPQHWSPWGAYQFAKEWIAPITRRQLAPPIFEDLDTFLYERARQLGLNMMEHIAITFSIIDLSLGLPGDILTKVDRMSMAHSLEIRVPFCDHRLVEWFAKLPLDLRVEGMIGKRILKEAFRDRLPEPVLHGRKRGFEIPLGRWLELAKPRVSQILLSKRSLLREWINADMLRNLLRVNLEQDCNAMYAVWGSLVFETWASVFLDGRGDKPAWRLTDLAEERRISAAI